MLRVACPGRGTRGRSGESKLADNVSGKEDEFFRCRSVRNPFGEFDGIVDITEFLDQAQGRFFRFPVAEGVQQFMGGGFERLNAGRVALRFERVLEFSKGFSIGRPHIAAALIAEEYVNTYTEAFDKYLGNHTEFYIPIQKLSPRDAIALIKQAGGLAVLAHPFVLNRDDIIDNLVEAGLDGVEVYYPKQPFNMLKHYREICHKYNLLETGGSDCHGPQFGEISLGSVKTPVGLLDKMKKRLPGQGQNTFSGTGTSPGNPV